MENTFNAYLSKKQIICNAKIYENGENQIQIELYNQEQKLTDYLTFYCEDKRKIIENLDVFVGSNLKMEREEVKFEDKSMLINHDWLPK